MISKWRPWAAYLIAAGSLLPLAAVGQSDPDTSGGGAPSGDGGGASSSFGVPPAASSGSTGSSTGGTATPSADPAPSFGTPAAEPAPPAESEGPAFEGSSFGSGASSSFGTSSGAGSEGGGATDAPPQAASAPTFTLPGFYGAGSTTLTGGEGRLGRPRFRYNVSFSSGYDDNVLQTPTEPFTSSDQVVEVLVDPGTPDTIVQDSVTVKGQKTNENPFNRPAGEETVPRPRVIPGRPPEFEEVVIPGVKAQ